MNILRIDIENIHKQGYDNSTNAKEYTSGVQQLLENRSRALLYHMGIYRVS